MKNLDLNSMGVQEMNALEMKETDGGGPFTDWLIGKAIDLLVTVLTEAAEAYIEYSMETDGKYVIHKAY
jgi:hypothetical protein